MTLLCTSQWTGHLTLISTSQVPGLLILNDKNSESILKEFDSYAIDARLRIRKVTKDNYRNPTP